MLLEKVLWRKHKSRLVSATLCCALLTPYFAFSADVPYQIKASYIYNILQFVRFPMETLGQEQAVRVCILGEDRFGSALNEIHNAALPQGRLKIEKLSPPSTIDALKFCNVLYVVETEKNRSSRILSKLDSNRTLTIGEFPSFIDHGGMIELYEENDRIRFKINAKSINATDFKLDAQLIQLGVQPP